MLSRRRMLVLLGATTVTAGAAALGVSLLPGDSSDTGDGPPTIHYGDDTCATCGMVIADARFASGWRDSGRHAARFDDPGCMLKKLREQAEGTVTTLYVHDYGDESWLDATTAAYVVAPGIKSPMAYGIAAFVSPERAAATAEQNAVEVLDWAAVLASAGKGGTM